MTTKTYLNHDELRSEWIRRESLLGRLGQEPDMAGALERWASMRERTQLAVLSCLAGEIMSAAHARLISAHYWPAYRAVAEAKRAAGVYDGWILEADSAAISATNRDTPERREYLEAVRCHRDACDRSAACTEPIVSDQVSASPLG